MKTEMKKERQLYAAPEVTVVTLATERGYSASLNISAGGNNTTLTSFSSGSSEEAWGGSTIPNGGGTVGGFTDDGSDPWN